MQFTCLLENEDGSSQRSHKKTQNEILEDAVFTWSLIKKIMWSAHIWDLFYVKKHSILIKSLANCGWLARFKSRYGIREQNTDADSFVEALIA